MTVHSVFRLWARFTRTDPKATWKVLKNLCPNNHRKNMQNKKHANGTAKPAGGETLSNCLKINDVTILYKRTPTGEPRPPGPRGRSTAPPGPPPAARSVPSGGPAADADPADAVRQDQGEEGGVPGGDGGMGGWQKNMRRVVTIGPSLILAETEPELGTLCQKKSFSTKKIVDLSCERVRGEDVSGEGGEEVDKKKTRKNPEGDSLERSKEDRNGLIFGKQNKKFIGGDKKMWSPGPWVAI